MDEQGASPGTIDEAAYPSWVDRDRYPFDSRHLRLSEGRLHLVDTGEGPPVVMLHGNPTWSFLYRHLVRGLADEHRCITPDLLGFGLSERPPDFSYRPAAHARTVERLFEELDLRNAVVVGHDWGGPIALDVATRNPDVVAGLVVMNTWMWPRRDRYARGIGRFFATRVGRRSALRYNLFARGALGLPFRTRSAFGGPAYRQYMAPLSTPPDRVGSWRLLRELRESREWLARLWDRRAVAARMPSLLVWGERDPVHAPFLSRWRALLPHAAEVTYDGVGHFVPEEAGTRVVPPVRAFVERVRNGGGSDSTAGAR